MTPLYKKYNESNKCSQTKIYSEFFLGNIIWLLLGRQYNYNFEM